MRKFAERPLSRDDTWNARHRDEAPLQRADRNFAELLQELLLVLDIAVGRITAIALTTAFVAGLCGLWLGVPRRLRRAPIATPLCLDRAQA